MGQRRVPAAAASRPRLDGARAGGGDPARLLALAVPAALLTGALGSQYLGGLTPCEMCHWQRWPHYAALALALAAFFALPRHARPITVAAALAILVSGAIGVFHAGVEAKLWNGLTQCTAAAGTSLEAILGAPVTRCDQVQWAFAGVSMAGWNAILSLSMGSLILWLSLKRPR